MTDDRWLGDATRNLIALVTATHHELDDTAGEIVCSLTRSQTRATLVAAVVALTRAYEIDCDELGMTFDDYIQEWGTAVARHPSSQRPDR